VRCTAGLSKTLGPESLTAIHVRRLIVCRLLNEPLTVTWEGVPLF